MAQIVEYILNLKDQLSPGIEGATSKVNKLESTLSGVNKVLGVIGISMGAFAAFEFLKGSKEIWEKMEFSISQVEAGLKSTGNAAGISFEEVQKGAFEASRHVKFAQEEILGMQSVLLTFPSITKDAFGPTTDIILDMSTRLGQDLKSSAIQVGKALQDPVKGVTALRRVGVNFNEAQTEVIKNLAQTNHLAEAQALIMKELNVEFSGSAQAAFAADAGAQYELSLRDIRLEVGKLLDKLERDFMPVALKFLEWVKAGVDWIKKNGDAIKSWAVSIGMAWIAFKSISMAIPIIKGIGIAMEAMTYNLLRGNIAIKSFGTSMMTAIGPVGLIAIAVGALVLIFNKLGDAMKEAAEARNKFLGESNDKELEYLRELSKEKGGGTEAIQQEKLSLTADLKSLTERIKTAKGDRAKEINDQITETLSKINTVDKFQQGLIPKPGAKGKEGKAGEVTKAPATKATGSKSVTINVSIKELVHALSVNTTNLKEGAGKISDLVAMALTSATRDFQHTALE